MHELILMLTGLFLWICILQIINILDSNTNKKWLAIPVSLLVLWGCSSGLEITEHSHYKREDVRNLVSASPSESEIDGAFWFFGGVINESRYYLLRWEVEPHLYKDFQVKNEVYIREDPNLVNTGKFVQFFDCHYENVSYDLVGLRVYQGEDEKICSYSRQEIIVPMGYVIKDLNI